MENDEAKYNKKNACNKNSNCKLNKEILELEKKNLKYNARLNDVDVQISEIRVLMTEKFKSSHNPDVTELENKLEELSEKKEKLILAQKSNKRKLNNLREKLEKLSKPSEIIKNGVKKSIKVSTRAIRNISVDTVSKTVSSTVNRINPIDKKIDINDVSETGVESLRMSYTAGKTAHRTIKNVRHSIRTTNKAIKTTKKAVKTTKNVVKTTGKAAYKAASFTVKATVATVKAAVTAAVHIAAAAANPIVIVIACIILVVIICATAIVIFFGGGAAMSSARTQYSISNPVGLGNIPDEWSYGREFLNTSKDNKKKAFEDIITNLYYDENDKTHSDLVYMERTSKENSKTIYDKSFAVDSQKATLKSAFDWNSSLTDLEILSITYIYLEKKENIKNNTTDGVYEVEFDQEIIDEIVNKLVMFSDNTYANQECPGKVCTKHVEEKPNPEFEMAEGITEKYLNAYKDWLIICELMLDNSRIKDGNAQKQHWSNNIQWRIDNWNYVYDHATPYYDNNGSDFADVLYQWYSIQWDYTYALPQKIEIVTYSCEHQHNLHSIGLAFFSKVDIMKALNFSENEIKWEGLTESGFQLAVTGG